MNVLRRMSGLSLSKRLVAATAALTAVAADAEAAFGHTTLGDKTVGQQPDGSYLVQTNQFVTPAGQVIKVAGRPFGLALSPDARPRPP